MREMWSRHGKVQTAALAPARPYTLANAEGALAAVTKDTAFARDFFQRFVEGSELPEYPALLARAGYLVRPARASRAWIGDTRLSAFEGEVVVAGPTTIGSPMYIVGLGAGDRITRVGDRTITTTAELRRAIDERKPGDEVRVTWVTRSGEKTARMRLVEDPSVEVVAFEDAGRTPTAARNASCAAWVGSRQ
jgi:predicted metalloprotease with PDZ domain